MRARVEPDKGTLCAITFIARRPLHGQASPVTHHGKHLFANLSSPLLVGRYHSLAVELEEAPSTPLVVTARSEKGEIMALAHRYAPTYGVQFHPESILTQDGNALLANFLNCADEWNQEHIKRGSTLLAVSPTSSGSTKQDSARARCERTRHVGPSDYRTAGEIERKRHRLALPSRSVTMSIQSYFNSGHP
ncbi:hypothetical protein H8B02_22895 [Bradyrhizobium sp. Pear77]|uniref:glutamine amidotransferase-related protein n=1 Tax=Bradyrhizobium altum TaxID=1571202 RepID=UPI00289FA820|nr:hypothetical protein [Bradyrhizobium altum]MCC8956170.1 hypothetical protein [Bradyrhizobium altum]